MNILRVIVVTAICGWLVYFLGNVIVSGLRSGRIAHTDSSSFCFRRKNPLGYWALIIIFTFMCVGVAYTWLQMMRDVFTF